MNRLFFAQMAVSSALALLRGFVLAQMLAPASFGTYALLVALGTFSASLLSFGHVERSFKRFPRLFVDGHPEQALAEADHIVLILARRAAAAGALIVLALVLAGYADWTLGALCAAGVAFTVGMQSAYISVHRASSELNALGQSALARGALALAFAAAGAFLASWPGAMIGEIVAAALGGVISRAYVRRTTSRVEARIPLRPIEPAGKELWLFSAFIVAAIPLYLDRTLVSVLFGNAVTGTYALLMLFVTGAVTLTSIVSQKLGPQLVRLQREDAPLSSQRRLLFSWCLAISAISILGVAAAGWLLLEGPLGPLGAKYDVTPALMVATMAMGAAQVSHLLEWSLISHDGERGVFGASAAYLAALAIGLLVALGGDAGLVGYMWVMAGGKLLHVAILAVLVLRLPGPEPAQGAAGAGGEV